MIARLKKRPAPAAVPVVPLAPAVAAAEPTAVERAAAIEVELTAARVDLAQAEAELSEARAEYEAALDRAALSAAQTAKLRIGQIEITVDMAKRLVERVAAAWSEACAGAADAAALAERERLRVAAEESARAYEAAFREDMPEVVTRFRKVQRLWAVAQMAHEAAADAGITLPGVDHFRHVAGRPREDLGHEVRDLWLHPATGEPFDDDRQERIKTQVDGTGSLSSPRGATIARHKRRYRFTTYRPAVPMQVAPTTAKEALMPALFAGERAGYVPPDQYSFSARAVLDALDMAEQVDAKPRAEPPVKTERKAIEPAREVAVKREPTLMDRLRHTA